MIKKENNDVDTREELYRYIDHQIDTVRHYEELSWKVVSLQATIGGLLLTAIIIAINFLDIFENTQLFPSDFSPRLDTIIRVVSEPLQLSSEELIGLASTFLIIEISLIIILSVIEFFVFPIVRAYQIQAPARVLSGSEWIQHENEPVTHAESIIHMRRAAEQNEKTVNLVKERWNKLFRHLLFGAVHIVLLFFLVLSIVLESQLVLVYIMPVALITIGYNMLDLYGEIISKHIKFNLYNELGIIVFCVLTTATVLTVTPIYIEVLGILMLLLGTIFSFRAVYSVKHEHASPLMLRNWILTILVMVFSSLYIQVTSSLDLNMGLIGSIFIGITSGLLGFSMLFTIISVVRSIVEILLGQ